MQFKIVRAVPADVQELNHIMETVTAGMEKAEWFISDDMAYIKQHIGNVPLAKEDSGFILKAVVKEQDTERIAGFFMADFSGVTERNLGTYLQMPGTELELVAHMDSVVILPEYRGHGLQCRFIEAAEAIIERETDYRILLATVHPDNRYSLRNVVDKGYQVAAEIVKSGVYRRYILKKEIA
ncbi:MAG: GNAT family N-acetyltransferase [Lachnospiraceae bacterium]|nr:GNAT family N-acetyltransferase [Lachnospiraceae bacterium]